MAVLNGDVYEGELLGRGRLKKAFGKIRAIIKASSGGGVGLTRDASGNVQFQAVPAPEATEYSSAAPAGNMNIKKYLPFIGVGVAALFLLGSKKGRR